MEKSWSPTLETSSPSKRSEAEIIERIIHKHKRLYADVKSEDVECDLPSASSCKDDDYSNMRNDDGSRVKLFRGVFMPMSGALTTDKRQMALLYDDPCTGRSFRFLLHRKNARKADIYTCAKCKSRRKYVRIMVQNDKFLCDPASLDHICYMNPTELHEERIRLEERKRRKRLRLLPCSTVDVGLFDAKDYLCSRYDSAISDEGFFVNSPSNSPKSPTIDDQPQAMSLDEIVNQTDSMLECKESRIKLEVESPDRSGIRGSATSSVSPSVAPSRISGPSSSISCLKRQDPSADDPPLGDGQAQTVRAPKEGHYQTVYRPMKVDAHPMLSVQPSEEIRSMMSTPKDEFQTSEQEPSEPQPSAMLRNEVCLESIKMALESIPPANRQKAHVDILRYVYTTIFDKYLV